MTSCALRTSSGQRSVNIIKSISDKIRKDLSPHMSSSFLKYQIPLHKTLGSKTAALLFSALEFRFQKKPEGFYKFLAPCNSPYYRKGDSLSEEIGLGRTVTHLALKKICCSYKTKTLYKAACEELGELGAFQGKPFLSYYERNTGRTFYRRDYRCVKSVKNGTFVSDIYVNKVNFPEVRKSELPRSSESELPRSSESELPLCTKKTIHRIPPYLSSPPEGLEESEQPEGREDKNKFEVEQPLVSLETLEQMIDTWRRLTTRDMNFAPSKNTIENLRKAYGGAFGGSLQKWEEYCLKITTCKYLMGETKEAFKLNIAWASKQEAIDKIQSDYYNFGDRKIDRKNLLHYDLEPITDSDPIIRAFKETCLSKIGKASYIAWIKPMMITKTSNNEIRCIAPSNWFAHHISLHDMLEFGTFVNYLPGNGIMIETPRGDIVSRFVRST